MCCTYCIEFYFTFLVNSVVSPPTHLVPCGYALAVFNNISLLSTDVVCYCIEFQVLVLCLCKTHLSNSGGSTSTGSTFSGTTFFLSARRTPPTNNAYTLYL